MHDLEVSRTIQASPTRLYELISDLPRMGEWSHENTGGSWLKGSAPATVGAKFKGTNRNGKRRWSTLATVVAAAPGEEFAFEVTSMGLKIARWGYVIRPDGDGTTVTETWDDRRARLLGTITGVVVGVRDRKEHNRRGMEQTLERLSAAAVTPR